jgi:hypothetical protein
LRATLYLESPGSGDYIELQGDDELIAWQGANQKRMSEDEGIGVVSYDATFETDAVDTVFRIELRRGVDEGAPNSSVRMPAPFELTSFPEGDVSRTADLMVTWDTATDDDEMNWLISGECIESESGPLQAGATQLLIGAGSLQKRQPDPNMPGMVIPDSCLATITIERETEGSIDPGFEEGGSFGARQVRQTQFTTAP